MVAQIQDVAKRYMMYQNLLNTIQQLEQSINAERKAVLQPLIADVQLKVSQGKQIHINFICTHNSRRSHLAQIWAQVAAVYFEVPKVYCYSGGTEETALFPMAAETLAEQGFKIFKIAALGNPVYAIKYSDNALPIIGFSKSYDHPFNPSSNFVAVLTCSQADGGCPFIAGADLRVPITYEDPKISDGTPQQAKVYTERSLEIATEMFYVFSQIKKKNNAG